MLISMFLTEEYSRFPESRHSSKEGYTVYTVYISRQKALSSAVFFQYLLLFLMTHFYILVYSFIT